MPPMTDSLCGVDKTPTKASNTQLMSQDDRLSRSVMSWLAFVSACAMPYTLLAGTSGCDAPALLPTQLDMLEAGSSIFDLRAPANCWTFRSAMLIGSSLVVGAPRLLPCGGVAPKVLVGGRFLAREPSLTLLLLQRVLPPDETSTNERASQATNHQHATINQSIRSQ